MPSCAPASEKDSSFMHNSAVLEAPSPFAANSPS
jgi:hypothetical protein